MTIPLTTLLSRVESAQGPDRELDAEIALALGAVVEPAKIGFGSGQHPAWWTMPGASREVWPHRTTPWPLTASLDFALALVRLVRPGWACGFDSGPKTHLAFLDPHDYDDRPFGARYLSQGPTPALALLASLLRSLTQEEPQPEDHPDAGGKSYR